MEKPYEIIESILQQYHCELREIKFTKRKIEISYHMYDENGQSLKYYETFEIKRLIAIHSEEEKDDLRLKNDIEINNEINEKLMKEVIKVQVQKEVDKKTKHLFEKIHSIKEEGKEIADIKFDAWKKGLEVDENGKYKLSGLIGMTHESSNDSAAEHVLEINE